MKKLLSTIAFLLLFIAVHSQIKVSPESAVETGYLYDLSYRLSGMERFDGQATSPELSHPLWNQIYFEITKSALTKREFKTVSELHRQAKTIIRNDKMPLGLLFFNYNYLDESPEKFLSPEGILDISGTKLNERYVFAATSFRDETFNGSNLTFCLPDDFFFSNQQQSISKLFIDFKDGSGWQKIKPTDEITVNYTSTGRKIITLKAVLKDGHELLSKFIINVSRLVTPPPTATWPVQADISYNDSLSSGDAYILLAGGNTKLIKPIVVCEGIDLDNLYTWETLYELFNQQNMLEDLQAQGFDLVILNFHNPLSYMQSNAFLMKKLIEMVNDSIGFSAGLSVIGPSMGGMVTRYALTYMENQGIDHNTDLYISFEAPHQGANIPLGLQYEIYFFKDLDASIQMMFDLLQYPAPRQMLSYLYTDPPSSPAGHNAFYDTFQNELDEMGAYPANLRKIAISNGRGDGVGQPYNAGDQVIQFEYNSFLVNIKGNAWAVENNAYGQIFEGLIDPLIGATDQLDVSLFSPKPFDNAPGGTRPTFAEIDSLESPFGDIIALHPNHAYIPVVSALDIDTEDLFYNIAADPQIMQKTPFDSIYWAADNYDHTYISPETAQCIISEILNIQPKTQNVTLISGWNDLSSYIDPSDKNIENVVGQLGDDLIVIQHFDEVYWPEGGFSTLTEWDYKKGYLIKVLNNNSLDVSGNLPGDKSITIDEGWNLIPVLCTECTSLEALLGENIGKVKVIREGIGLNVFWPELGIYALTRLVPGNSYYLYANESFILTFE